MSSDPLSSILPMCILDVASSSKTSHWMGMALKQFGDTYNRFLKLPPGKPRFVGTKYAHCDTDAATSNVCLHCLYFMCYPKYCPSFQALCEWGNGKYFRDYIIEIWDDWRQHKYKRHWNLVIVHCWCHITGYLIRNDKVYKEAIPDKAMWIVMKAMILVYFRCIKLALSIEELMAVINELMAICTIQFFPFDGLEPLDPMTENKIIEKLKSEKTVFKLHEVFTEGKKK
eukprot:353435_1